MQHRVQQLALGEGGDRLPPFVEFGQLQQPIADSTDLDLIQQAGSLFPVTGDKRRRAPAV